MALYSFLCLYCAEQFDASGEMANPPQLARCERCDNPARRVFTAPQFTQDSTRLFRNSNDGTNFSYTLGKPMPDSRTEYYRELDKIGAEPVSKQTMPESWKENAAYKKHVATGGDRDKKFETARHPSSGPGAMTVSAQMKAKGIKIG